VKIPSEENCVWLWNSYDSGLMNASVPGISIGGMKAMSGQTVRLHGWLHGKRSGGKVCFLVMRDGTGICQCVVEAAATEAFAEAGALTHESSFEVTGVVRVDERAPGGAELAVTGLRCIQRAEEFPITRKTHGIDFLMTNRHLWLRSSRPTAILKVRHTVIKAIRDFFDGQGFTLVDMPILVPGAGEDRQSLFPVAYFDENVFLTQTGQLYLESACMALGKVYCFGPTFRAEKSKTRRHLTEFWMVEPEMAFAELDDVMALAEAMICAVVGAVLKSNGPELELLGRDVTVLQKIGKPFPRLTYSEVVEMLRSEATRKLLEDELCRDTEKLRAMMSALETSEAELGVAKKGWQQDKIEARIRELRENIQDLEQDIRARPEHIKLAQSFAWGKDLGGSDETIVSRQFDRPVFVTEYPREAKAFYMKVSPRDPRLVRNFDLLAPEGYGEIIGGSQREEDSGVIEDNLRAKGLKPEDYSWYLDLRRYGSVPHGGFGLGVERTVAWLCGLKHVRETIAFPRTMGRVYP
jgi:asparaginyl-tRNA synthetase